MKKVFLIFVLLIGGCGEPIPTRDSIEVLSSPDCKIKFYDLGRTNQRESKGGGSWSLIELEYKGNKHVILRNYDSNNQSMIELKN